METMAARLFAARRAPTHGPAGAHLRWTVVRTVPSENDVLADGVGARIQRLRGFGSPGIRMNSHPAEVVTKPRLHETARLMIQRLTRRGRLIWPGGLLQLTRETSSTAWARVLSIWLRHAHDLFGEPVRLLFVSISRLAGRQLRLKRFRAMRICGKPAEVVPGTRRFRSVRSGIEFLSIGPYCSIGPQQWFHHSTTNRAMQVHSWASRAGECRPLRLTMPLSEGLHVPPSAAQESYDTAIWQPKRITREDAGVYRCRRN